MSKDQGSGLETRLIEILHELLRELRPEQEGTIRVTLESRLDRDLGLDSLSRVELLGRIETCLGRPVPEASLSQAETVQDLLVALLGEDVELPEAIQPVIRAAQSNEGIEAPVEAETLLDVLRHHAERIPDRVQVTLYDDNGGLEEITYADLYEGASRVAGGLRAEGIEPGRAVALMLPTSRDFLDAFFGVILAGGIPVPLYPPVRPSQLEDHLRRQGAILRTARVPCLITIPEAQKVEGFLRSQVPGLGPFRTPSELREQESSFHLPRVGPEDIGFLQFTSGSTGNPKGVVLTHANLLANVRAVVAATRATPEDVFVSWLPLYHDMGLIGAVLGTLYAAVPLVLMSPLRFLARPARWLEALEAHGGTMTAGPNFAYELCVRKVPDEVVAKLDLSRWRLALNGAEAIAPGTLERFQERFGPCGVREDVMQPVYGLAECSVGLTAPRIGQRARVDRISKADFETLRVATPVAAGESEFLEFASCGAPMLGHDLRVVDDLDLEVPERQVGRIQFRGPSATSGYFENPEATRELITEEGWLNSGDLGYTVGGEVYLTGRAKDLIIRGGRNLYPQELEELVGEIPGVRKGNVAVFAARDARSGTERLVVLAETRETDVETRRNLEDRIREVSAEVFGSPAEDVVLAAPGAVLKTSSGKIRRGACRDAYERSGGREMAPAAPWIQFLRVWTRGLVFRLTAALKALRTYLVTGWFWTTGVLGFLVVRILVQLMPTQEGKGWAANLVAWWTLRFAGVTLSVSGEEWIQDHGPVVYVSNHTSYLDSLVLLASLPPGTCFTPKRELLESPIVGWLSRALRFVMVERFERSEAGAGRVAFRNRLEEGDILHIFPEGTCVRAPGLLPFRMGAFLAAAETGVPIRPLVLRGVRNVLRPSSLFAWPGPVEVEFGPPIGPEGSGWKAALELRNQTRAWILSRCGEPDLAWEDIGRFAGERKMPII